MKLTGDVLIGDVADLKEQLLECLSAKRLTIDLADVTDCDTAGVQLIVSLCKGARASGRDMTVVGVSTAVRTAVDRAALDFEAWFSSSQEGQHA